MVIARINLNRSSTHPAGTQHPAAAKGELYSVFLNVDFEKRLTPEQSGKE
jgi:hypothetical protein